MNWYNSRMIQLFWRLFGKSKDGDKSRRQLLAELKAKRGDLGDSKIKLLAARESIETLQREHACDRRGLEEEIDKLNSTIRVHQLQVEQLNDVVARDRARVQAEQSGAAADGEVSKRMQAKRK